MKKLLFYCQELVMICTIALSLTRCSKENTTSNGDSNSGNLVQRTSQKTGIVEGYVSPVEAKAVVFISQGFFNANINVDPVSGKYSIEDVRQGTYTMEAVPTNPDYKATKIQDVMINGGCTTSLNFYLDKN